MFNSTLHGLSNSYSLTLPPALFLHRDHPKPQQQTVSEHGSLPLSCHLGVLGFALAQRPLQVFALPAFLPPVPGPMPVVMSASSCWNILFPVLVLAVGHSLPFSPGARKILGMGVWLDREERKNYMLVVVCSPYLRH